MEWVVDANPQGLYSVAEYCTLLERENNRVEDVWVRKIILSLAIPTEKEGVNIEDQDGRDILKHFRFHHWVRTAFCGEWVRV